jgi:hypothetical protein
MAEPDERPIAGDIPPDDSVSLTLTMESKDHSVSDVACVVESIDNLVMASIWGALAAPDQQLDENLIRVKQLLRDTAIAEPFLRRRTYPFTVFLHYLDRPPSTPIDAEYEFDPFSPYGAGLQAGMNTTLRHLIRDHDRELYSRLFSFARVRRLEHHSPLLLETVAVIGVAAVLPAILLYGCFWAVYYARRTEAQMRIRETDAELKQEELNQARRRSQMLEDMANAIKRAGYSSEPLRIPEAALAETARVITPTVSQLATSPLIGSVTIGLSKGK